MCSVQRYSEIKKREKSIHLSSHHPIPSNGDKKRGQEEGWDVGEFGVWGLRQHWPRRTEKKYCYEVTSSGTGPLRCSEGPPRPVCRVVGGTQVKGKHSHARGRRRQRFQRRPLDTRGRRGEFSITGVTGSHGLCQCVSLCSVSFST